MPCTTTRAVRARLIAPYVDAFPAHHANSAERSPTPSTSGGLSLNCFHIQWCSWMRNIADARCSHWHCGEDVTARSITYVPRVAYCVQFSERAQSCRVWHQRRAWQSSGLGRKRDALGDHPGHLMTQRPPPGPPTCAAGENTASSGHGSLMVRLHLLSCWKVCIAHCFQICSRFLHLVKAAGNPSRPHLVLQRASVAPRICASGVGPCTQPFQ